MINKKTDGFAIASLIMFVIGIIGGWFFYFLGIIFGIIALLRISKNKTKGRGIAITGLVLCAIPFLITIMFYSGIISLELAGDYDKSYRERGISNINQDIKTNIKSALTDIPTCLDGTSVNNPKECLEVKNFKPHPKEKIDCNVKNNYNEERIIVERGHFLKVDDNLGNYEGWVKYYPSLKEGYIGQYPFNIINYGCTKLVKDNFKISFYLYHNGKIILKKEHTKDVFNINDIFPGEDFTDNRLILSSWSEGFKITEEGDYNVILIVYYNDHVAGVLEDTIRVHG